MAQHKFGHPSAPDRTLGPCGFEQKAHPHSWAARKPHLRFNGRLHQFAAILIKIAGLLHLEAFAKWYLRVPEIREASAKASDSTDLTFSVK